MNKTHVSKTSYPAVPNCTRCDNNFDGGCYRVQAKTGRTKWKTTDWLCLGCAKHLELI